MKHCNPCICVKGRVQVQITAWIHCCRVPLSGNGSNGDCYFDHESDLLVKMCYLDLHTVGCLMLAHASLLYLPVRMVTRSTCHCNHYFHLYRWWMHSPASCICLKWQLMWLHQKIMTNLLIILGVQMTNISIILKTVG